MVICVSAGREQDRLAVAVEQRVAGAVGDRAVRHQAEPAVARQARPARRVDGEVAVAGDREVERIAGVRSACRPAARARSRGPACRRSCAPPRGAAVLCWRLSQSLNSTRSALKPGVLALAMLSADHVHGALLRDQARRWRHWQVMLHADAVAAAVPMGDGVGVAGLFCLTSPLSRARAERSGYAAGLPGRAEYAGDTAERSRVPRREPWHRVVPPP